MKNKTITYILEIILLIFLFFTLFVKSIYSRLLFAIILVIITIVAKKSLQRKKIISKSNKKQVLLMMTLFSIIYVVSFYVLGIYLGFAKNLHPFSIKTLINYIIPITIIIITSEVLRNIFISQKVKLSPLLFYISSIMIDMYIYASAYNITSLNRFLKVIGFVLFSAISCNLLYGYISKRYGHEPIIIYRLVTILYMYIIPVIPDVYIFARTFLRMLYPYLIYITLEYSYARTNFATAYKDKKSNAIFITSLVSLMALIIMFVSCEFKYGILVIGSGSMTGTIDYGDAVVFESYKNQDIKVGDIIIFEHDGSSIIHRCIQIKKSNNEYHYYTKGDANILQDENYVTPQQIKGIVNFKVKYIGYPSLWIRKIFE